MKTSARISPAIIALALFFHVLSVNEAKAQQLLSGILKRMEQHQKSLSTLRSKITMTKYDAVLSETDVYAGTMIYSRADGKQKLLRIDWTKPAAESLFFMNGQYTVYRPRLKQAIVGKIDQIKNKTGGWLSFLGMSKKELKANYAIRYLGNETVKGGIPTWHLSATPKKPAGFKSAEFWIAGSGMLVQGKVLHQDNDTTTILLSDLIKNETIDVSIFRPLFAKGTRIIGDSNTGCPCFKPDKPRDALRNWADAVFSGTVVAVNNQDYTFQTERIWKGSVAGKVIVRSFYAENNCSIKLKMGERYVVFARKINVEGKTILATPPCSFTSNIATDGGKKVLKEIGKGTPVKKASVRKKRPR
ncbi:MAG TPA: outer-membrane lipoprotein carrier protein LolA [Pyrinomonadaceae bacterium]|jgi:outer membrane lipoprotein-sorting protein